MKIVVAAVAFIFMAAAADARHVALLNNVLNLSTETTNNVLGDDLLAPVTEPADMLVETTGSNNRKNLIKKLIGKKDKEKPGLAENAPPQQDQNPAQNPTNQETGGNEAQPPQEVKAIPKARRVEKPAKVEEGSAKRPSLGSAKRGNGSSARPNATTAKPDRPNNPGQVNRASRASRPTGGGRPANAGRPNKGKGKD